MTAIEIRGLTKEYRARRALDGLTVTVEPGRVTGFLGPNGAGKSTTLRILLGLDRPTAGSATFGGRAYTALREPLRHVGALLDAGAAHGGRTARDHLRAVAAANRLPAGRVARVLDEVGLSPAADRRVRTFSLGMRQRLGVATALLGDPAVLLLDEPANGLDPEGIVWLRRLLRRLAAEGRTVLVSSHLMAETAATADHVVVLGRGRLLADRSTADLVRAAGGRRVRVRTAEPGRLAAALTDRGLSWEPAGDGWWLVADAGAEEVGRIAAAAGAPVLGLADDHPTLEQAYLDLTGGAAEFAAGRTGAGEVE
ncbi:ATP-binding cassette domain-containing protein [Streptomyces pactum]|uniref:ATP-binding cassette domain-containing protein n=1 Tax=Streptomyces pactum TaxID=68249 RepID=A0ABS0NSM8_9ACTN|nr:ATP-binding cassette domain-containing protein [Streptomyces pactum]MBH5338200.1 ATP-binding cassette domain-containing protein [Streptomyces pactum]